MRFNVTKTCSLNVMMNAVIALLVIVFNVISQGYKQDADCPGRSCCGENCIVCDPDSNSCMGCKPGFWNGDCAHGCPTHCRHGVCHQYTGFCVVGCTDGYYDQRCNTPCQNNCCVCSPTNGTCLFEECPEQLVLSISLGAICLSIISMLCGIFSYRCIRKRMKSRRDRHRSVNGGENNRSPDHRRAIEEPCVLKQRNTEHRGAMLENQYEEIVEARDNISLQDDRTRDPQGTPETELSTNYEKLKTSSYTTSRTMPNKRTPPAGRGSRQVKAIKRHNSLPTCWVGVPEEQFELLNKNPDIRVTDIENKRDDARRFESGTREDDLSPIEETMLEDDVFTDSVSVRTESSEVRRGYISPVHENDDNTPPANC